MWIEIAKRVYRVDDDKLLPPWNDQSNINLHQYMAGLGRGFIARKREVRDGFVYERMMWKEKTKQ